MKNISLENKFVRGLVILAVGAIFAWSLYWYVGANTISKNVENWIAENGVKFAEPLVKVKGFPFGYRINFDDVTWQTTDGQIAMDSLSLSARPWAVLTIYGTGENLSWTGRRHQVRSDRITADVELDESGRPRQIDLSLTNTRPNDTSQYLGIDRIDAIQATGKFRADADVGALYTLDFNASGIQPDALAQEFSEKPAWFAASLTLNGDLSQPNHAGLQIWQQNNGSIDINGLDFSWDQVRIVGNGTVALDRALQPKADGTIQAAGLLSVIERLEEARHVDQSEAAILKLALMLFSGADKSGKSAVKFPLRLVDRNVLIGPVKVATVPLIHWPE